MNEPPGSASPVRSERAVDIALVVILALATLAAAWSSYQATRWSGVQSTSYSQAAARRVDATRAATQAGQLALYDNTVFSGWLGAYWAGNTQLEAFEAARFRPEFKPAFAAWLATKPFTDTSAPSSPFVMPGYLSGLAQPADDLEAQASELFDRGIQANQRADDYVLNTVVLAACLFFAGLASRFAWRPARLSVLAIAALTLAYGLANVIRYPIY